MGDEDTVEVLVRLRPEDWRPAGEVVHATPVDAHDGGGTYRLRNTLAYARLMVDDVVRCQVNASGHLQVVDVVEPSDLTCSLVYLPGTIDEAAVARAAKRWVAAGALGHERQNQLLLATVWRAGTTVAHVRRTLAPDLASGLVELVDVNEPHHRTREHQGDVDFALDPVDALPPTDTSYWVGDDPWWAEHGYDDPTLLAHVQTVAGRDPEMAAALERGDHRAALRLIGFANGGSGLDP